MNKSTFLVILFLCNPLTLYLVTGSLWISFMLIILFISLYIVIAKFINNTYIRVFYFNFLSIFSILYHAELIFSIAFSSWNIPNFYESKGNYYFNRPVLNEVCYSLEFNAIYRTNLNGYRIANNVPFNDLTKNADILFIGDSFTQGAQVDYSELFSTIVADSLPNYKVVNAGISGAGIIDEFCYFMDMGRYLSPKCVVLELGVFNDFMDVKERHSSFNSFMIEHSNLYRFLFYNLIGKEELPLGRWTEPIFPEEQKNVELNILYKKTCPQKELDKNSFKECLIRFKTECDRINCKLIVVLLPSKEQISSKLFEEVINEYKLKTSDFDLSYPNRFLAEICDNNSICLLDLFSDFRQSQDFPFLLEDEHMNQVGHSIVGKGIVDYIKNNNISIK